MFSKYFSIIFCAVILTMICKGEVSGLKEKATSPTTSKPSSTTSGNTTIEGTGTNHEKSKKIVKNDSKGKALEESKESLSTGKHNLKMFFCIRWS